MGGSAGEVFGEKDAIGFGCMGITAFYGSAMTDDAAVALLKGCYEAGYRHFDTAELYRSGNPFEPSADSVYNEAQVGKFLRTVPRGSFTVATKYFPGKALHPEPLAEAVPKALDASLARLGLDCVDIYYLHRMPKTVAEVEDWVRAASACIVAGKCKHIGLSECPPAWLDRVHREVHPIFAVQQEWSLLTRDLEKDLVPLCKALGVAVVAYSPLARNLLAGPPEAAPTDWRAEIPRYAPENFSRNKDLVAQIARLADSKNVSAAQLSLSWLLHKARALGVTVVPIPGTTKLSHAKDNLGALAVDLNAQDMATLEELGAMVAGQRGSEHYMSMSFQAVGAAP